MIEIYQAVIKIGDLPTYSESDRRLTVIMKEIYQAVTKIGDLPTYSESDRRLTEL